MTKVIWVLLILLWLWLITITLIDNLGYEYIDIPLCETRYTGGCVE